MHCVWTLFDEIVGSINEGSYLRKENYYGNKCHLHIVLEYIRRQKCSNEDKEK